MEFECSSCGACCRKAAELELVPTKDGHCIHLTPDNQCEIYATRPAICNIATSHALKADNGLTLTQAEYFALSATACNLLMDGYQLDTKWRVDPSIYTEKGQVS